jgi:membrane protease subunit HflC
MSGVTRVAALFVIGLGGFVFLNSIYTVNEVEQVIITQFGKPVGEPITEAGLKFKTPFIQEVNPIDKRVLEWDGAPSDMPTKDKLYISVDLFARWRVVDPLQYFLRLRDERSAQSRLDDILGSETRNAVAKHELIEIIRTTKNRVPLRDATLSTAGQKAESWLNKRYLMLQRRRLACLVLSCWISALSGLITTPVCAPKFTIA